MNLTQDKIRRTLVSPVLYVNPKRSEIDVRMENFLFCSRGLESKAYKGTIIVDSNGNSFKIIRVKPIGKIKLWTSIKYFSPVVEVIPEIDGVQKLTLEDFKRLIIDTVSSKPKKWSSLNSIKQIKKMIECCDSYKDVMKIFNLRIK